MFKREKEKKRSMVIEHVTYDTSHQQNGGDLPPPRYRPHSPDSIVDFYLKEPENGYQGEHTLKPGKPIVNSPLSSVGYVESPADCGTPGSSEVPYMRLRDGRMVQAANPAMIPNVSHKEPSSHRPTRPQRPKPSKTNLYEKPLPPLPPDPTPKRSSGFAALVKDKFTQSPPRDGRRNSEKEKRDSKMVKIVEARNRISMGTLERALPPELGSKAEIRAAPPRPPPGQFSYLNVPSPRHANVPPVHIEQSKSSVPHKRISAKPARKSSDRKSSDRRPYSTSGKLVDILGESADMFDEARRELTEKFRPPFDHLNYPSSRSKRDSNVSPVSDESFYYKGEDKRLALRERQRRYEGNESPKLTDEGTDLWNAQLQNCRLCRKKGAGKMRGLCRDCENDFLRPTRGSSSETSRSSAHRVRTSKPEVPLKDMKSLNIQDANQGEQHKPWWDRGGARVPQPNIDADTSRSQTGRDEKYRALQTPAMRVEYDKDKKHGQDWDHWRNSSRQDTHHQNYKQEDDTVPLVRGGVGRKPELSRKKKVNFYDFHDDDDS